MAKQDNFIKLIESYKQKHNITLETDLIRLFIREADSLLTLAIKSFDKLATEPTMGDDFGKKLLTYYKAYVMRLEPEGDFSYLTYYWGFGQNFIVPGFLTTQEEIKGHYDKIAAENLYWIWVSERRDDWLDRIDFTFSISRYQHDLHLDRVYDEELNQGLEGWDDMINLLLSFDDDPRYHMLVNNLYHIPEAVQAISKFDSYEDAIDKWEFLVGNKQRFPFRVWGVADKWRVEVEKQFEAEERELIQKCRVAYDPQLLKRDFLEQQIKDNLGNGSFGKKEYITYIGLKKFPFESEHLTKDRFEQVIDKMVAVKFRDQLYRQVNQETNIIDSPDATTKELAIIAALMNTAGIFKSEKAAYEFMALHFRVRDKGKSISQKTPDALRKALTEIKKTTAQTAWKVIRNKFEAYLSTES